jgi:hypothetical protein
MFGSLTRTLSIVVLKIQFVQFPPSEYVSVPKTMLLISAVPVAEQSVLHDISPEVSQENPLHEFPVKTVGFHPYFGQERHAAQVS